MACESSIALDGAEVAKRLGISHSHFHVLRTSGRFGPAPLRFGRAVRFSCTELEAWVAAGVPTQERWEQLQARTPAHAAVG